MNRAKAAMLLIFSIHCAWMRDAARAADEQGKLAGAEFRISMPEQWNGSLVLWCPGYSDSPGSFADGAPGGPFGRALVSDGYAYAETGYSSGGIAVNEGYRDVEELRRYFAQKFGRPKRVFVVGESMGGGIALALVESRKGQYDAGLAFCGMLSPPATFLRQAFDLLAIFAAYFPDILPPPGRVPATYKPGPELMQRIAQALASNPEAAATLKTYAIIREHEELARILAFHTDALRELTRRCGGNAFSNRSTVYSIAGDSVWLNKSVPRFDADPAAARCAHALSSPSGNLSAPFLAVDAAHDPVVPGWSGNAYLERIANTSAADWFVRQFLPTSGHCAAPTSARVDAFRQLVRWVDNDKAKPKAGLR